MPQPSTPATAEGVSKTDPEDLLNEVRDMCSLIFMAISSMPLEYETKALAAGVYDIERKLEVVALTLKTQREARNV